MKIHHIGYAVSDINKGIEAFTNLGFTVGPIIEDHIRNVNISFASNSSIKVEIIAPINEKSPVSSILKKSGPGTYHICYNTPCIDESLKKLKANGYLVIQKPLEAVAINNQKVAFLYHKTMGLIEIVEE